MPTGFPDYYGGLTLPVTVPEGGTGQTSITDKALLYGAGTSKLIETNIGTSGQTLQIDPATLVPTFEDFSLSTAAITGILPIANGGTGSSSPALVAGTGISITGSWPDQTITNSSNYASLADPLPVAHGGTGTSSPALVAGSNISITGSWPDQTISLVSAPTITGNMIVQGRLLMESNGYPGLTMTNTAGTAHWSIVESSSDGSFGPLVVYDEVNAINPLILNTDDSIILHSPLAIAYGGTGSTSPALVAGTGISITGSWPDQTITNSSNYASLADPLPVAHGGTGTSAPALVAGSNISITGSWPDQTITVSNHPHFSSAVDIGPSGGSGFIRIVTTSTKNYIETANDETSDSKVPLYIASFNGVTTLAIIGSDGSFTSTSLTPSTPLAIAHGGTGSTSPALVAGTGISITGSWPDQTITNTSNYASMLDPLPTDHGGTGYTSLDAAGITQVVKYQDLTAETASIASSNLYTPTTAGMYRVDLEAYLDATNATETLTAYIYWTQNAQAFTELSINITASAGNKDFVHGSVILYGDASYPIKYSTTWTNSGSGDSYDLHIRVTELPAHNV